MRDPGEHTTQESIETLEIGAARPTLVQKFPTRWRQPAVGLLGFAFGVGAVLGWPSSPRPSPPAFHVDEHDVELLLFDVTPPRAPPRERDPAASPLQVDSAAFLSGAVTSTVVGVGSQSRGLDLRAAALPVTLSPTARFRSLELEIIVRDCEAATRWTPADRPFTITWRDEHGRRHVDRAGDFDRSVARALVRYVDTVCGPRDR